MKDWVILDLETPNSRGNSISAISVLLINDGKLVKEYFSLINPEDRFDARISNLTGITADMVQNKPTFNEYWNTIADLLSEYVIIGHNVIFDISVISNTLYRYDIKVPKFKYIDTLKLSRSCLDLDSYTLTSIMDHFNFKYRAHDALEDTRATYMLFEYLCKNFEDIDLTPQRYEFKFKLRDKVDSKLEKNINELYGIIQGINYDGIVNKREIQRLNKWINDNDKYIQYRLFYNIISSLKNILKNNKISEYERLELLNLVQSINHSKIYSEITLSLQVLHGIIDGIICDDELVEDEMQGLKKWLNMNDYLSGSYLYDKVKSLAENALIDKTDFEYEKEEILINLKNILNPIQEHKNQIELKGKKFCLTGEFKNGNRGEIKRKLESMGAISKNQVSSKVDYLIVGEFGSEAWKFGYMGNKICKAQEFQEKGSKIKIILEDEFFKAIN